MKEENVKEDFIPTEKYPSKYSAPHPEREGREWLTVTVKRDTEFHHKGEKEIAYGSFTFCFDLMGRPYLSTTSLRSRVTEFPTVHLWDRVSIVAAMVAANHTSEGDDLLSAIAAEVEQKNDGQWEERRARYTQWLLDDCRMRREWEAKTDSEQE